MASCCQETFQVKPPLSIISSRLAEGLLTIRLQRVALHACAPPCTVQNAEPLPALSPEQQRVVDLVVSGKSVFFTGCAGTGKSLVIKHILRALPPATTYLTASTGLAASALGGTTLNAFAGIGCAEGGLQGMLKMASRTDAAKRWRMAATLIIDEISMVDGDMLDSLEEVARAVRRCKQAFGGLQLVLTGDFHQLPPVAKGRQAMAARRFAFEAHCWDSCVSTCMLLTKVYRQEDREFVDILSAVRGGRCSAAVLDKLKDRCRRPLGLLDGILPTKLYTHTDDVDAINSRHLAELSGEAVRFVAQDSGNPDALKSACNAKQVVELKAGAQVMLTRNISANKGLVNGARGVVERFVGKTIRLPVVRFASGLEVTVGKEQWTIKSGNRILATRTQIPLACAWALSVHKSQGMTLDRVEVNLARAFEAGMAYVALSRARSLQGLHVSGDIHPHALQADPRVIAFYAAMARQ
ncbi:g11596 [Coccomyxa elongata]